MLCSNMTAGSKVSDDFGLLVFFPFGACVSVSGILEYNHKSKCDQGAVNEVDVISGGTFSIMHCTLCKYKPVMLPID